MTGKRAIWPFPHPWGLEVRGGETQDNEKQKNTLAKGVRQTTRSLDVEHYCAELVKGFVEAAGLRVTP